LLVAVALAAGLVAAGWYFGGGLLSTGSSVTPAETVADTASNRIPLRLPPPPPSYGTQAPAETAGTTPGSTEEAAPEATGSHDLD